MTSIFIDISSLILLDLKLCLFTATSKEEMDAAAVELPQQTERFFVVNENSQKLVKKAKTPIFG